jgi:hypothetical protein
MAANLAILAGERPEKAPNTPEHMWTLANECWRQDPSARPGIGFIVMAMST